ncbi:hypothetical protein G7Z17_g8001 [Cylindrodendrum hubeiense]|uniref:Zn(2)-C6 fungal-type domain-containing protein n=1 Tax=Cylindrodendrum hubeiense TaxID=595255 RepID=A0A9P5LES2_9HYPO|nr:hypothetical protein G7Z17_g8001 [Cylindrodendrum hubeiense]
MNPTKWRISKACQECRVKKIKCNGQTPCESCKFRGLNCVYREKARNRMRKTKPRIAAYETIMSQEAQESPSLDPSEDGSVAAPTPIPETADNADSVAPPASIMGSERSINNTSVAATHRASPSCLIQLYYGPSSNFALLNSIYHQIEGTRPKSPPREGVEEVGPGLDLFSHRRLFFGDLADNQRPATVAEDYSAMLLDPDTAKRLLERYLLTYWHGIPVLRKDTYRRRLDALFRPPGIFDFDSSDTIIIMLAMALGASMTGEEAIAEFLFQKAKQGAAKLDEVVNTQVVQIHLMMIIWNAANEIRRELHRFAEKQSKDMKFGLVGDPSTGELGVCQAMVSTMYHHTLLLTFRPFLILRAKLKQDNSSPENNHSPPSWLDTACEYCLEAARNSIGFLTGSCATNILCQDIKYHGFFIEGACYALAFDMLQERKSAHRNLPWIHSALRCLRSMVPKNREGAGQLPVTIAAIEQMVRSVFPDLELRDQVEPEARQSHTQQSVHSAMPGPSSIIPASGIGETPAFTYPSMPFGFDISGGMNGTSPSSGMRSDDQIDFTAADVGWDIDFGTMDMETFLSLDAGQTFNFAS